MIIKSLPELLNSIKATRVYCIIGCDVLAMVTIIVVRFMKNRWIITSMDLGCNVENQFDLMQSIIPDIEHRLSYTYSQYAYML